MKVIRRTVPSGDSGVQETLRHMARLAKRDAKNTIIKEMAEKLRDNSATNTIKNVFVHVVKTIPYVADPPDREKIVAPIYTLTREVIGGDCDCQSTAMASLLLALGFKVGFKVIAWDKARCNKSKCPFSHVYVIVKNPDLQGTHQWMPLDAVLKYDGFGREKAPVIRSKMYRI